MGWFSKKDDAKKDEPKKAESAPAPAPPPVQPPRPAPAPQAAAPQAAAPAPAAPAPTPAPAAAPPPQSAAAAAAPRPQPAPQPAAPTAAPAQPAPAAATASPSVQPDTDPTRTFAALMRVALLAPQTQRLSVEQLRMIIEPAIATGQFVVAASGEASAAVMWATVSHEIDKRARTELDKPFEIAPNEWRSGPHPWLVAVMGDTTTARSLIDMVGRGPLKGAPLFARMTTPEGAPGVASFTHDQPAQA